MWDVIGWAGLGEENLLWVGMGKDRMGLDDMGWCGTGAQPAEAGLSSPTVQDVIRITVQPESQVVAEGTQVSLTCCATGPPGLTYQWFCGRQEVRSHCATLSRTPAPSLC